VGLGTSGYAVPMSRLGQERLIHDVCAMSAITLRATKPLRCTR